MLLSLLFCSLMFSCSSYSSSKIFQCCEWVVDTPWLLFGTQGRYTKIIVTLVWFLPPLVTYYQYPNLSSSSPDLMIGDVTLDVKIITDPPGLYITFHDVIVSDVDIFFLPQNCFRNFLNLGNNFSSFQWVFVSTKLPISTSWLYIASHMTSRLWELSKMPKFPKF